MRENEGERERDRSSVPNDALRKLMPMTAVRALKEKNERVHDEEEQEQTKTVSLRELEKERGSERDGKWERKQP